MSIETEPPAGEGGLTPASARRRAEMIAAGQLRPRRREDLAGWAPLPADPEGPSLSEILAELRALERA